MTTSLRPCTACGAKAPQPEHRIDGFSCFEGIIPEQSTWATATCTLAYVTCPRCGTIFNAQRPDREFLEDRYFRHYSATVLPNTGMQRLRDELFEVAWSYAASNTGRIYQDSCQYGNLLLHFQDRGWHAEGGELDGSGTVAAEQGLAVRQANLFQFEPEGGFDLFVSAHVLEHVDDCAAYLDRVAAMLVPGGKVVIELPCFEDRLEQFGCFQLIACHASYYTKETVQALFERQGFRVDEVRSMINGAMAVLATNIGQQAESWGTPARSTTLFEKYITSEQAKRQTLKTFLEKTIQPTDRIAFYGAGGTLNELLFFFDLLRDSKHVIVDGGKYKYGRRMGLSEQRIQSPEALTAFDPNWVIITALSFEEEIAQVCRPLLSTNTGIIAIHPVPTIMSR